MFKLRQVTPGGSGVISGHDNLCRHDLRLAWYSHTPRAVCVTRHRQQTMPTII